MKYYDNIILGAGASGCICAMTAGKRRKHVLLLDKNSKPAKKILVTGNGRCNITNNNMKSDFFNQNIDKFLEKFDEKRTLDFFDKLGLLCYHDEEGRFYPLSNSAKSVTDILGYGLNEAGVEFQGDTTIVKIEKQDDKYAVFTDKGNFLCKKLVVSLGGNQIDLIKDLCKTYPCSPSLVALKTSSTRNLSGSKISSCLVTLTTSSGKTHKQFGEVLFKDSGVSGICIFNLSATLARQNDFSGEISIDIFPDMTEQKLVGIIKERKNLPRKINQIFDGLLLPAIGYEILNRAKLNESEMISSLNDEDIVKLVKIMKNLNFKIKGLYDNNQVFSGGIALEELNDNLMSKRNPNLYFAGEICDVDGTCGGYNLQWAWTSGRIVGDNL